MFFSSQAAVGGHMSARENQSHSTRHRCFPHFPLLPAEIRCLIWEYSLPDARVYEVFDAPSVNQRTPAQEGLMFANLHPEPPPALSAVCRESRSHALRHYKPLKLGQTTKFVDLARDLLLLESYLLVKRLHRTLHFMSRITLIRENMNSLALGTQYGVYAGICHPALNWKISKANMGKFLSLLAKFTKLNTLVFVVHQEFQFQFDLRNQHPHSGLMNNHPHQHPPHPPTHADGTAAIPTSSVVISRPQLIHQAYRFKFDIESSINYQLHRPHVNKVLYYPLVSDEDEDDDWDAVELGLKDQTNTGWCEPWPTNDDWRRFKKRFQRQTLLTLASGVSDGWTRSQLPTVKGASLLWRYTRGRTSSAEKVQKKKTSILQE